MECNESVSYAVGPRGGIAHWLIVATSIILGLITIIGNVMILCAVYSTANLQTISNYFLCSLAVADLSVGCLHTPFYTVLMALDAESQGVILRLDFFIYIHILFCSTLSLCTVSIDRYIAVKSPLKYLRIMTIKPCVVIIILTWAVAFTFATPAAFIVNLKAWSGYIAACAILTMLIPLLTVTLCYVEIVKISHGQMVKVGNSRVINLQQQKNNLKNKKAVKTFAIVTLVFLAAFTPNFVSAVWFHFTKTCEEEYDVFRQWTVSLFVMFSSSFANPLIYWFRNRDFKVAFKVAFNRIGGRTITRKTTISSELTR